jgi:hypothetical protein
VVMNRNRNAEQNTGLLPPFSLVYNQSSRLLLLILLQLCLTLFTACTARDSDLENALSAKLQQVKNSNTSSIDLNDVLGKNWRKVCVQGSYTIEGDFKKYTGEKVRLLDISENEIAFWVFYKDGSARAAIINRSLMDFVVNSKASSRGLCTSGQNPYISVSTYSGVQKVFYFSDQ